jgi:hypothetical protein
MVVAVHRLEPNVHRTNAVVYTVGVILHQLIAELDVSHFTVFVPVHLQPQLQRPLHQHQLLDPFELYRNARFQAQLLLHMMMVHTFTWTILFDNSKRSVGKQLSL